MCRVKADIIGLLGHDSGARISERAPTAVDGLSSGDWKQRWTLCALVTFSSFTLWGCARLEPRTARPILAPPARVVVVAPVLNLSDRSDWDPAKVTDMVAAAWQSVPGIAVIPVNRVWALLSTRGISAVETPEDALALAQEFGADATVVTAITEFDPFNPPRVGIVMQCYRQTPVGGISGLDPVGASRQASDAGLGGGVGEEIAPLLQAQRVFDASDEELLREVRQYGASRRRAAPSDWRVHVRSQQLFLRYACWSAVRSIMEAWERRSVSPAPSDPNEAAA